MSAVAQQPSSSSKRAKPAPRYSNTGGNFTWESGVKLDWVQGSFRGDRDTVTAWLQRELGGREDRPGGVPYYRESCRFEYGGLVGWSPGRPDAVVSLPGKACTHLGPEKLLEFIHLVRGLEFHATRIDAAWDDFDGMISMERVHHAARTKGVLGFRKYQPIQNYNIVTAELRGDTAEFGSRGENGSGKFVRIYNKGQEQAEILRLAWLKGEDAPDAIVLPEGLSWVRVEVEFNKVGERAQQLFDDLAACADVPTFAGVLAAAIGGAITFVDRSGSHGHVDRMGVVSWWQRFVDLLGQAKYRAERRVKTALAQTMEWADRCVGKPLAKIRAAVDEACGRGAEFIAALVGRGVARSSQADLVGRGRHVPMGWVDGILARAGAGGRARACPAAAGVGP